MNVMRKIQLITCLPNEYHAGAKAPSDAMIIARRLGFEDFIIQKKTVKLIASSNICRILWFFKCCWYLFRMPKRAVVFIQYPENYFSERFWFGLISYFRKIKKIKTITLIHDLNFLRCESGNIAKKSFEEIAKLSDIMIVHNQRMFDYLEQNGIESHRMVKLGIFDYLGQYNIHNNKFDSFLCRTIVIAGNLDTNKARYLKSLYMISGVKWRLYGVNFKEDSEICKQNIEYCGSFPPDELMNVLDGGFGLVWDGDSLDSCSGFYGNYLKYNNPHKLSLYLAVGLPVIIWQGAAEADFVLKEGVGLAIDSLKSLECVLTNISETEYIRMHENVYKLSERLRTGIFLTTALEQALKCLNN